MSKANSITFTVSDDGSSIDIEGHLGDSGMDKATSVMIAVLSIIQDISADGLSALRPTNAEDAAKIFSTITHLGLRK